MAIKSIEHCSFIELPQNYTWVTELTQKECPGLAPVILHARGAKKFKNLIDGKDGYAFD